MYLRAHEVLEEVLGREHAKLATPLRNLANLYEDQGKLEPARQLHQRSIAILEKAFGPTHRKVVKGKQNLSRLMQLDG